MKIKLPRSKKKKEAMLFAMVIASIIGISTIAEGLSESALSFLAYAFGILLLIAAVYICMPGR